MRSLPPYCGLAISLNDCRPSLSICRSILVWRCLQIVSGHYRYRSLQTKSSICAERSRLCWRNRCWRMWRRYILPVCRWTTTFMPSPLFNGKRWTIGLLRYRSLYRSYPGFQRRCVCLGHRDSARWSLRENTCFAGGERRAGPGLSEVCCLHFWTVCPSPIFLLWLTPPMRLR